jgi:DNA-binding NarL/FixJ family response regulator
MTRVLIAEDHTLVRVGMRLLLETIPDVEVVAEAADGLEAVRLIRETRPDCVLMDLGMPRLSGLDALRIAKEEFPGLPVIILSMHSDEAYVHQAMSAGADGYLLKGSDREELELALRSVTRGHRYLTPAVSESVVAALTRVDDTPHLGGSLRLLTPRQREVLRLVAEGNSTKQVARQLGLSAKTVEAHRGAITQRLGIKDLPGLVRFALKAGLIGD